MIEVTGLDETQWHSLLQFHQFGMTPWVVWNVVVCNTLVVVPVDPSPENPLMGVWYCLLCFA